MADMILSLTTTLTLALWPSSNLTKSSKFMNTALVSAEWPSADEASRSSGVKIFRRAAAVLKRRSLIQMSRAFHPALSVILKFEASSCGSRARVVLLQECFTAVRSGVEPERSLHLRGVIDLVRRYSTVATLLFLTARCNGVIPSASPSHMLLGEALRSAVTTAV